MMISAVALSTIGGVFAAPQLNCRGMRPNEPAVFAEQPIETYDPVTNKSINDPAALGPRVTSARFRLFLAKDGTGENAEQGKEALKAMEAGYDCFVGHLGWNSTGLRMFNNEGQEPYYKTDVYLVSDVGGGFSGLTHYASRAWIQVNAGQMYPGLTVHEWGHAMQWHQGNPWPSMDTFRIWSETFAQWVAETYMTSDLCAASRAKYNQTVGDSLFQPFSTIGRSYLALVDGTPRSSSPFQGNNYDAWPFFHYLTRNPDGWRGMGRDGMMTLVKQTLPGGGDETPLHVLQRVLGDSATVQQVVGKYWARMAYADIDHAEALRRFDENKNFLNKDVWDRVSDGVFKTKHLYSPRYMGAVFGRLLANGDGSYLEGKTNTTSNVAIAIKDATGPYVATLAVRNKASKKVKYIEMPDGKANVTWSSAEEATLVVVNAPEKLISYVGINMYGPPTNTSQVAPESQWDPANREMTFSFTLSGADLATY